MREYLCRHFDLLNYPENDCRELLRAFDFLFADKARQKEWDKLLSLYRENPVGVNYSQLRRQSVEICRGLPFHGFTAELLLFLCLSRDLESFYEQRGIPKRIFLDSMRDLKYKAEECRMVYGICGSFVAWWFPGFFQLDRFALGRLQFEPETVPLNVESRGVSLHKGDFAINIHIPRDGTPLDEKSVENSLDRAVDFYRDKIGEKLVVFVCSSWLLYPETVAILPEKSNVKKFADRFTLWKTVDYGNDHPDLWRLFDREYHGNPDTLPYDTSLRRAFVDHIKAGGKTGEGFGYFVYQHRLSFGTKS